MKLQPKDLGYAIRKAAEITGHYKDYALDPMNVRRSIDDMHHVCGKFLGKKIKAYILDPDVTVESIRGATTQNDDTANIYLVFGLKLCWSRFVFVKELMHVVLDLPTYRNTNVLAHIEQCTQSMFKQVTDPKPPVVSERMAEIAAMEFMFPFPDRLAILKGGAPDCAKIAEQYKVPLVYIELYLSPEYMENLAPFPR